MDRIDNAGGCIPLRRTISAAIYESACSAIPGGVNSPVRAFSDLKQTPLVVERGYGDRLMDCDGYSYIDYCCSWGALIHGHAHPRIIESAVRRLNLGSSFGVTTAIEQKFASYIVDRLPWIKKIRFVSSGTEATMSAIRLARGYTGRDLIVKFIGNYHGHSDALLVGGGSGVALIENRSSSAGVPKEFVQHTLNLPYNDINACLDAFARFKDQIAAVIVEPVAANMGVVLPGAHFLSMLKEQCEQSGALLIFDEVITGFRLGFGGAAGLFAIEPDLCCYGKILGGGFAAAAFGGSEKVMALLAPLGPVYQAGTLSGNPVAMEAGLTALMLCERTNFYEELEEKTRLITEPVQRFIQAKGLNVCLNQVGSLFTLFFGRRQIAQFDDVLQCNKQLFNRFFQFLFQRGIYLSPSPFEANFVSAAHSQESLITTRDVILEALETLYDN